MRSFDDPADEGDAPAPARASTTSARARPTTQGEQDQDPARSHRLLGGHHAGPERPGRRAAGVRGLAPTRTGGRGSARHAEPALRRAGPRVAEHPRAQRERATASTAPTTRACRMPHADSAASAGTAANSGRPGNHSPVGTVDGEGRDQPLGGDRRRQQPGDALRLAPRRDRGRDVLAPRARQQPRADEASASTGAQRSRPADGSSHSAEQVRRALGDRPRVLGRRRRGPPTAAGRRTASR